MSGKILVDLSHKTEADEITADDVMRAIPFDRFAKNPEFFEGAKDELFESMFNGSTHLPTRKQFYQIGDDKKTRTDRLEVMERRLADIGLGIDEIDMKPEIIPVGGGKCDIVVKLVAKERRPQKHFLEI